MLIDTHCHLDFDRFDEDRDEVVARARAAGVNRIIVPAIDPSNFAKVISLTEQYDGVYAAIGVHPNSTAGWEDGWLAQIRALAAHEKVVAIGEIGLDYYWDRSPKEVQHHAFSSQLALAAELDLPVIVHNRDSSDDVVRLLAESPLAGRERPGVLHSFSAPPATAEAVLALGFYLGFTGPLTFKKADDLRAIAAKVPLDRLLVETDAPFLTPHPYRGKPGGPYLTPITARMLAGVRGMNAGDLAEAVWANAETALGGWD